MKILVSGGTRTIDNLRKHPIYGRIAQTHIGGLITPRNGSSCDWYLSRRMDWACDNDCFQSLDRENYIKMLKRRAGVPGCLWVTAPDVVGDAEATLIRFKMWRPVLDYFGYNVAFVCQDGLRSAETPWDLFDCFFVGGSTEWKLGFEVRKLIKEAKQRGKWVHMGRCNSRKRLSYAISIDCDSVDGSGFSRFSDTEIKWAIGYAATNGKQLSFESELTA